MTTHRFFLMIWILFLSCFAISFSGIAEGNLPTVVKKIQPSVVAIVTYDKKGEVLGQGSGFFISKDGNVITNMHMFDGCASAQVKTADGNVYNITKTLAEDREGNLIRVSVDILPKTAHPLTLSTSLSKVGEKVIVVGSPDLERTVSDGIISGIHEIPTFGKIIKITAPLSPGYSGSPVINMKGEVVGLVTFQITEGHDLNFTIHSKRITKLIPDKNKTFAEWIEGRTSEWFSSSEGLYSKGLSFLFSGDYENALGHFEEAVRKILTMLLPVFKSVTARLPSAATQKQSKHTNRQFALSLTMPMHTTVWVLLTQISGAARKQSRHSNRKSVSTIIVPKRITT